MGHSEVEWASTEAFRTVSLNSFIKKKNLENEDKLLSVCTTVLLLDPCVPVRTGTLPGQTPLCFTHGFRERGCVNGAIWAPLCHWGEEQLVMRFLM